MLKLFKTKLAAIPFVVIFIFMFSTRFLLFFKNYPIVPWETPLSPFSLALNHILGTLSDSLIFQLTASFIIVAIHIGFVSVIIANLKNAIWKSFLTPWIFILCMSLHPKFLLLSPQLISLTFLLMSIYVLLKIDNTSFYIKYIFLSSFFIGIAAAFWLPSIFFLLIVLFYIQRNNIFDLRSLLVSIIATLIPFLYVLSYIFITEKTNVFYNNISLYQFPFQELKLYKNLSFLFVLILSFLSLFKVGSFLSNQLKETKTFFTLIFVYNICFLFAYFFHFHQEIAVWIFFAFPISTVLNVFFNSFKRIFIAEVIHVTLLLIILVNFIHLLN